MSDARDQSALELQALQGVIASGARALDLDVVLDRCLEQTLHVAGTDVGLIYLREAKRGVYRLALGRGVEPDLIPETFEISPLDERVRDYAVVDLSVRDNPRQDLRDKVVARGLTHALVLILHVDEERVGFVAVLFHGAPSLAASTLRTLEAISAFEAVAIQSARVHRQVELRVSLAHALRECAERLLDPDADVPGLILETACRVARGDRAFVTRMVEKAPGDFYTQITHAVGHDAGLVGQELSVKAPYLCEALAQTVPTVVEDTSTLDPTTVVGATAVEQGTRSLMLLTMRKRGSPIGQLFVGSGEPRIFEEAEVEAMRLLSSLAAEALERARREAEQRAEHDRIAAIVEDLSVVVAVATRTGEVLHVNAAGRAFAELMGPEGSDWRTGMQSVDVYDRDGKFVPIAERGMMRAFAGETRRRELTLVSQKNGRRMHILAVSAPLRAPDGTIDAVLTSFQDVTELRELADAKDRFLSIASHELRSPITSLRATTSLLQLDPAALTDEVRRATLLSRIQRQIDRLSTLVERLLDTTRLNAGELPLEFTDCDMTALCADAVEHARMSDRERTYTLDSAGPITGRWDPARIEQVLTNLLNNACRYSAVGSEVTVRPRADENSVTIDVIDRGVGIATEQLDRLFTPFFRGTAAQRHKGGLGLGLYITREIVRRHGGTMSVESKLGEGSTFTVELPRRPAAPP